ncbi:hypothetical protein F1C58_04770 [Glaciihabitans sp. INWT7]|uniref:hypothetical protein n=1 Tax=Glaciihabitans sp. INWT7 TaxID=2596912 RepID=UPI001623388C|nr:hypothetical protein [Glaciihabitans sp. INWT7]QNE46290.1 hypothetical protein F1C58_04770 [Glaciihabitans sp. INWT7]
MPILTPASRSLKARVARATNDRRVTPTALAELRREFIASALADYMAAKLADAPQLTREQSESLHAVIRRHARRSGS